MVLVHAKQQSGGDVAEIVHAQYDAGRQLALKTDAEGTFLADFFSRFDSNHKLVPGERWQVFETHTFRGVNAVPEPREALVTDVTGDKKNDLIVLVHDRILVYPQE